MNGFGPLSKDKLNDCVVIVVVDADNCFFNRTFSCVGMT